MHRQQQSQMLNSPSDLISSMPLISPNASFLDIITRRKRQRFTILAFVSLLLLSTYTILLSPLTINTAVLTAKRTLREDRVRRWPTQNHHRASTQLRIEEEKYVARDPLQLTPEQELAAVASFISSLPSNVLPPSVDTTQAIDPQLVLGFDLRADSAAEEMANVVHDVWHYNPVILFSRVHSPLAREVKSMLKAMNLRPAPLIFEVDERADADVLIPLLHRLTSINTLPNLLIGGQPVGSIERIRELHQSGELQRMIASAGAVIDGGLKKKKKGGN